MRAFKPGAPGAEAPGVMPPSPAPARPPGPADRLRAALTAPVDASSLAAFRFLFGGLLAWDIGRYFAYGWIGRYYVEPAFHFTYYGFGWVQPWPPWGMYAHFAVLGVLAVCIAVGYRYRAAMALFAVGFGYVFLLEQAHYLNHFYLILLLSGLMAVVPAHRVLSVDRHRAPGRVPDHVPAWTLWLLRGQLALVYGYAAVAKMNADWLAGQPMGLWLSERALFPVVGPLLAQPWAGVLFSYAGLAFDLLIVPLLLWRRSRALAVVLALGFHLTNAWLFTIGVFPWMMIAATTLFFEPDWPRRAWRRLAREPGAWPAEGLGTAAPVGWPRWGLRLFTAYALFQILVPLRHFAYPGVVHWTEEGHRFSWHMKLRDKEARALFIVTDRATHRTTIVDPASLLAPWQVDEMASRPDMIQQFAHHLAERHGGDVRVGAEAWASLNGRPEQQLVAPTVDLAGLPRSLWSAPWIRSPAEATAPLAARTPEP